MPTCTRTSLLLFALATPLTAQVPAPQFSMSALGKNSPTLDPGAYTRTEPLELNRDDRADVALLVGSKPVIAFSPGVYEALKALPTTALDLAPLHGRGLAGADAVVISSTRPALEKWSLDLAAGAFTMTQLTHGGWGGVTQLATADLDGDGLEDVLGISADRQKLLVLMGNSPLSQSVSLGESLWRLTPIEWDGTSGLEIALLTSGGIRVIERTGACLLFVPTSGSTADRFCAVRTGLGYERLSTLVAIPDGTVELFTADHLVWDGLTFMGNLAPVAIVPGEFDLDGLADVCISHKTTGQIVYFENQLALGAGSFSWASGAYALWDPTSDESGELPAPENEARPLVCDLDQDGDGDVAFPLQKEKEIALLRNRARDPLDLAPRVASALYHYDDATSAGALELTLAAPLDPPREDDALQVIVWRQPTLKYEIPVEKVAIHHALLPVGEWPMMVSIPLVEPLDSLTLFHIELRLVDVVEGAVTTRAATAVWTFTTSAISKDDMIAYGVPPEQILDVPIDDGEEDAQFAPGSGGWTGPMPCIPCFAEGDIPDPGN